MEPIRYAVPEAVITTSATPTNPSDSHPPSSLVLDELDRMSISRISGGAASPFKIAETYRARIAIEPERRADVRVRSDPGGVVVGGPGDEAGSQPTEIAESPESGSEGMITVVGPSSAGPEPLAATPSGCPFAGSGAHAA